MFLASILSIIISQGFIGEPFPVADAEVGHNQTDICSAMAQDGRFAVAWVDLGPTSESDVYLRFFDINGQPATSPIKMEKLDDSSNPFCPCLGMDSAGNTVLAWVESNRIRFQQFTRDGTLRGSVQTVIETEFSPRPLDLDVNSKGEFVVSWAEDSTFWDSSRIWIRRYSSDGTAASEAFIVHDGFATGNLVFGPAVALNEEGYIAAAWSANPLRLQVFDTLNQRILNAEPSGKTLPSTGEICPELHWLDDQRFILFSMDDWPWIKRLFGTVFAKKGTDERASIWLVNDTLISYTVGSQGVYSSAVFGERFALNYTRKYSDGIEDTGKVWIHQAAVVGNIVYNAPGIGQGPFEYTPPLGADTVSDPDGLLPWRTTVSANESNLVWGYSRFEADSTRRAYVTISDWNITGVAERPVKEDEAVFSVGSTIGSEVVLRYQNFPEGFKASVFDASGRKVDALDASGTSGSLNWGRGFDAGVYFIKVESGDSRKTLKVVLVH